MKAPTETGITLRLLADLACLAYLVLFALFYYRYVPLVLPFQAALVPLLLLVFVLTLVNLEKGFLVFAVILPLINSLPYFFGIQEKTPHAPPALTLFLVFFFAWLLRRRTSLSPLEVPRAVVKPALALAVVVIASGVVTFLRYTNFYPARADGIYEIIVNDNGVRAGGALMSVVFGSLSYLTGLLLFVVAIGVLRSGRQARRVLIAVCVSLAGALAFALVQKYHSLALGNLPSWVYLRQINATFKDPNSFGGFLSALFPVLLALLVSLKKRFRLFPLLVLAGSLFLLPDIGSRSTLLAVAVSTATLFLGYLLQARFRMGKAPTLLLVGAVAAGLLLALAARRSVLSNRLSSNIASLSVESGQPSLLTGRPVLWSVALRMIGDYPLTGVGPGSYVVELPNYLRATGQAFPSTDSAENYFLQAGSEMGIVGLGLTLWLLFIVLRSVVAALKNSGAESDSPALLLGAASGIVALFASFLFHSFIGGYEVIYMFWILAAFVVCRTSPAAPALANRLAPGFRRALLLTAVAVAGVHLWCSSHSLSIGAHAQKFGWDQNFGLYGPERDDRGVTYRWAKAKAGLTVPRLGRSLVVPALASHPDIRQVPVRVSFYVADEFFRKRQRLREIVLDEAKWTDVELPLPDSAPQRVHLLIETSRSWTPARYSGVPDPRSLAVALGEIWSRYPSSLPSPEGGRTEKAVFSRWEGPSGSDLLGLGRSWIRFSCGTTQPALRLRIRGQEALGVGPLIVIRVDNEVVGKTLLMGENWQNLVLSPMIGAGEHVFSVEFTNDFYSPRTGQDRNVFLGSLEVVSEPKKAG